MNKMYATCVSSMHLFDSRSQLLRLVPNFLPGSANLDPGSADSDPRPPTFRSRTPDSRIRAPDPGFPDSQESQESGFLPKKGPGPQELRIPDPQARTPENRKNAKNTKKPKNRKTPIPGPPPERADLGFLRFSLGRFTGKRPQKVTNATRVHLISL